MAKSEAMADAIAVAKISFKFQQELPFQAVLVKLQDERISAFSTRDTSLECIISEFESSAAQLREEISSLPTQATNIQTALTAHTHTADSVAGTGQE